MLEMTATMAIESAVAGLSISSGFSTGWPAFLVRTVTTFPISVSTTPKSESTSATCELNSSTPAGILAL